MSTKDVHSNHTQRNRLLWAFGINLIIALAEVAGGIFSNSLALISDAFHNVGDSLAILLSYFAILLVAKPVSKLKTFGNKRAEILIALFNAAALTGICLFLIIEAIERFMNPSPISGGIMLWVAVIGLVGNLVAVFILHQNHKDSLNIKSAYLHLMGDTLSSVAVVAGSILILWKGIYWIDPLITIIISIYIIIGAYEIIKQTVHILMQGVPEGYDLKEIKNGLEKHDLVESIHHVHLWMLNESQIHFECHAMLIQDMALSSAQSVKQELTDILEKKYHINHVTIQLEINDCSEKNLHY
ncbi:MAG: cation diffusion facilitator family transporter [Bacteroidales bacterium]|nr:cation diffusion facilitator family transporter [Bacteroidales bacterium]